MNTTYNCISNYTFGIALNIMDPVGMALSFMCIVCWSKVLWEEKKEKRGDARAQQQQQQKSSNIFKYLLAKAVCDFCKFPIFWSILWSILFEFCIEGVCSNIGRAFSYWAYWSYFMSPLIYWLELTSSLLDLAATIDCLLIITEKFKFALTKTAFYVITTCTVLIGFAVNGFEFFWYVPVLVTLPEYMTQGNKTVAYNYTYYYYEYDTFGNTSGLFCYLFYLFFRDLFVFIFLVAANAMILIELGKLAQRRAHLMVGGGGDDDAVRKAEKRKGKMIVWLSLSNVVLNVPFLVSQIIFVWFPHLISTPFKCYEHMTWYLSHASYALPFVFYYAFNLRFQAAANLIFYPFKRLFDHGHDEGNGRLNNTAGRSTGRAGAAGVTSTARTAEAGKENNVSKPVTPAV